MPRTVAFRHLAFEDLGLLEPALARRGHAVRYMEAGIDPPDDAGADLFVVLGGPIGIYQEADYPFIPALLATLQRRLAAGRPTLGICLGAQAMARALGARVYPGGVKEIGWAPVGLSAAGAASCLAPLAAAVPVLHWHGDTFDLPTGAAGLAGTPAYANQAFQVGRHALALQFHLEVPAAAIERWLIGHAGELAGAGVSVGGLRRDTQQAAAGETARAECLDRWLDALAA